MAAFENCNVLFPLDCDGKRLAQLAIALGLFGAVALSDHRVKPVEADVPVVGLHRGGQLDALLFKFLFFLLVVTHGHDITGAVIKPLNGGGIVVALQEFGLQGDTFLFDIKHHAVDKRRHLSTISQVTLLGIARLTFAWIRFTAEIRIAFQHMAPVFNELRQHVGPGADGPEVECQVFLSHAGLRIEPLGLPWNGCKKCHRQPVLELGVFALDPNP